MSKCFNCIKNKENDNIWGFTDYCQFCFEHDYCNWEHDKEKPLYSYECAKQLLFDCAMNLHYNLKTEKEIENEILNIINELDKMKIINF